MSTEKTGIDALRERYDTLSTKKTVAETNLHNAQTRLEELQREAVDAYGTSDLGQLRLKLKEMEDENDRKTREYQQHLDEIEMKLREIETNEHVPNTSGDSNGDAADDQEPFEDD